MSEKFEKLKTLLMELFQLDQPDLDFGLYRIMHAKSAEVTQFLDQDLLPQVKAAFALYKTADKAELKNELTKAIEQAKGLGADPETVPKVKELRAKLADLGVHTAVHYPLPIHLQPVFRGLGFREGQFPVTEEIARTCVSLPLYPEMPRGHVARVAEDGADGLADWAVVVLVLGSGDLVVSRRAVLVGAAARVGRTGVRRRRVCVRPKAMDAGKEV